MEKIVVRPSSTWWKARFAFERALLRLILRGYQIQVHHIGSTAVPRLPAKPIIDILIAVRDFAQSYGLVPRIERLGYAYMGEADQRDQHYFVKGRPATVHLYIVPKCSETMVERLAFRDYLLENITVRRQYGELKLQLAEANPDNFDAYQAGKLAFIQQVMEDQAFRRARDVAVHDEWIGPGYIR